MTRSFQYLVSGPTKFAPAVVSLILASMWNTALAERRSALPSPEQPSDAYLPASHFRGAPTGRSIVRRGPFTSVQVNVDENGRNIIGDAANEPSIAYNATDPTRMAIGWRQFDNVASNFRQAGWSYSHDAGRTWTFPGVIEPGVFRSDPVLGESPDGALYFYSLTSDGPSLNRFECTFFKSADGGATWNAGVYAFGGDKAWMTVDKTNGPGRGNIYAYWTRFYSCCNTGNFTRSVDGGKSFDEPITLPSDPYWGTLSVGPDGELYVIGIDFAVLKSSNARFANQTPVFEFISNADLGGVGTYAGEPNPGGLVGQAWIATNHRAGPSHGDVYILASVDPPGPDPLDLMFTRSSNGGFTWSPPIRINDDPLDRNAWQWFGTMDVSSDGRIDVVWNDTRDSGGDNLSELYYVYSFDSGQTWSRNIPASPSYDSWVGWPNQDKLGDYYDMFSLESSARVAYAATFNGEQDAYYVQVGDCNSNAEHDGRELQREASLDLDLDGILDECQICVGEFPDYFQCFLGPDLRAAVRCFGGDADLDLDVDLFDLAAYQNSYRGAPDCNGNSSADECDLAAGQFNDCNRNDIPDDCDLREESSRDCNGNTRPDECDGSLLRFLGRYNDHAYYTTAGFMSFDEARRSLCLLRSRDDVKDAYLAAINDCEEQAWLNERLGFFELFWMGMTDEAVEGDFRWDSGEPVQFAFWSPGEPNDCCGGEDWSVFNWYFDGAWNDLGPDYPYTFRALIEVVEGKNPIAAGSDDGLADCNENGAADGCELVLGESFDCNFNHVPDECDVRGGYSSDFNTNGLPDECDALFPLGEYGGHSYFLTFSSMTFPYGRVVANSASTLFGANAYLVSINDAPEQAWLFAAIEELYIDSLPPHPVWMGYTDEIVEGSFVWDSGAPTTFVFWGPGEPNDCCGGQDYGVFNANPKGEWDDHFKGIFLSAVIEVETIIQNGR